MRQHQSREASGEGSAGAAPASIPAMTLSALVAIASWLLQALAVLGIAWMIVLGFVWLVMRWMGL